MINEEVIQFRIGMCPFQEKDIKGKFLGKMWEY